MDGSLKPDFFITCSRDSVTAFFTAFQSTCRSCPSRFIAFQDLDYHFKVISSDDDVVKTTSQLSGTHRGTFDLTNMKMGVIPATNKSFDARLEKTRIMVKENKITSWVVEPTEGAGLKAILGQPGIAVPTR